MSYNQDSMQETVAVLETLKEHYSLSSLTFSVPRQIQALVLPVFILVVWEAVAEVGVMSASRLPAPSVVAAKFMFNRCGAIKRIIPIDTFLRRTSASPHS
jgi:ABC-type nitrate/sulfonate/bicarbonate transport system permease component